jgi:riboflavin synthase
MFTGLIQEIGVIRKAVRRGAYRRLEVSFDASLGQLCPRDSIAVDGVCLTTAEVNKGFFSSDILSETQRRTTLGSVNAGDQVNLERPVSASDPLGGHIVLGHVDGMGRICRRQAGSGGLEMGIQAPINIIELLVLKGSIAVDGISLTVGDIAGDVFRIFLIPETQSRTTLARKKAGQGVNLEADYLAKLVKKFTAERSGERTGMFSRARGED